MNGLKFFDPISQAGYPSLKISYITEYHPYWLDRSSCERNPAFDDNSNKLLRLKENRVYAINYFENLLNEVYQENWDGCACMEIPSHDPHNSCNPVQIIIKKIVNNHNLFDYSGSLIRTKMIEKLSKGGRRDIGIHLSSMALRENVDIEDKKILLLDDVVTTGNSLIAACKILFCHGAKEVFPLALARTVRG